MTIKDALRIEPESVCENIENFIKDKVDELGKDGVILGLSGGIDSAVVAYLSAKALGAENVLALILPDKHSSKEGQEHANLVVDRLGIEAQTEDITPKLNSFDIYRMIPGRIPASLARKGFDYYIKKAGKAPFSTGASSGGGGFAKRANAFYRIKHRMRMVILYYYADLNNLLVASAANRTELSIGFFVKYGCDDAADIMPIIGLYKTQVRRLAEYLGVPEEIIDKAPSPDLVPGITDEYAIGLTYDVLDRILYGLEYGLSREQIADQYSCATTDVDHVMELVENSRYMRAAPYKPTIYTKG